MTRGVSSALATEAASNHISPVTFVKLELDSGTLYIHDGIGTLTWDSNPWLGVGDFGSVSAIKESDDARPFDVVLTLSGIDADLMDEVLNQDYYLRPVTIYFGALNIETGVLVADPDEVWSGWMDTASVSLGTENAISLQCESEFAVFAKNNGSAFSDADLQATYSGDLFFEFLPSMIDVSVVWRGKNATTGTTPRWGAADDGNGWTR